MAAIDVFVLCDAPADERTRIKELFKGEQLVSQVIFSDSAGTQAMKEAIKDLKADYVIIIEESTGFEPAYRMPERLLTVAENAEPSLLYADYFEEKEGNTTLNRLTDYLLGSVRNDFNFGPVKMMPLEVLQGWAEWEKNEYESAASYSLRLYADRWGEVIHLPEALSTKKERDTRVSGEKQFDYVRMDAFAIQKEMEHVCTVHLSEIGALLKTPFETVDLSGSFPVEASVLIPVRNRANTITEAIKSVLNQKTHFQFNLIVVDNHSTDGTTELIQELSKDHRLIHHVPDRNDLGIGGCWNEGLHHPKCGKFIVQLDSDDLYKDESTLEQIVNKFYEKKCAMVIGSYEMVDFDLNPLPPGIIDHREWSDENGPNNALRINGLGAPRAFFSPVLKEIGIPNVSYGEDYAIGIAISGQYPIGRIYEPIYLCRRWEGNSDAALSNEVINAHNHYKDTLRSMEILSRQKRNKGE